MKKIFFSCLFFFVCANANSNSLNWSMTPSSGLPLQTMKGNSYAVRYTITNDSSAAIPIAVSGQYTGGTFVLTSDCGATLEAKNQPHSQCSVNLLFQPIQEGVSTAQLTFNDAVIPLSSTTLSQQTAENIYGHVTVPLPSVSYTRTSYPVAFTFVNNGTISISPSAVDVHGFIPSTNTCRTSLAPNSTCVVSGLFSPHYTGQSSLDVTYRYEKGTKSITMSSQTNSEINHSDCHEVSAAVVLPLPTNTNVYADHVIKYVFTNHCSASSEKLNAVQLSASGGAATLTKGDDTCSNAVLGAGQSCAVSVSAVPNSESANFSVMANVSYAGGTVSASTGTVVRAMSPQSHHIVFVNQCDQNVWYEFQNGNGPGKQDPTPSNQRAFSDYLLPVQLTGAAPSTKTLSVDEYVNGAIYGRTGCDTTTGVCATANCPVIKGTGTCQVGVGAMNPTTIFELYMPNRVAADGVYDVSLVNGFNLPGEIKSLAPLDVSNPFGCGQATGAVIQPEGSKLGICPWTFSPPNAGIDTPANYMWVSGGSASYCATTCVAPGEYCGMAYSNTAEGSAPINRRCGTFLGYWSLASYVGYTLSGQWGDINLYDLYMKATLPPSYGTEGGASAKYADMYACRVTSNDSLDTGYRPLKNVCGCYDWDQQGSQAHTAEGSKCLSSNADWLATVFPRILFLKKACPTAYSYQFDDPSSSFTCNVPNTKTSYEIVFCPAGRAGRPG